MELSDELKSKIATTLVAAAAALVVTKGIDVVWKLATGNEPPSEDDPNAGAVRLAIFAGVSAVAATLARQAAISRTQNYIAAHK